MGKIAIVFLVFWFSSPVSAASQQDEIEGMGNLAGVIYACGAHKPLYQFEEILSQYFKNSSSNQEMAKERMRQYARAKASSFSVYRQRKEECASAVDDFLRMPILQSELYSDGTIRLPDGKFLYPKGRTKLAADAKKIYPAQ